MVIVYDSMTGNCLRFVKKLPYKYCHIEEYDGTSPFILVTYTINFGQTPESTKLFMNKHYEKCLGISSSGNKNWGGYYGKAADNIKEQYGVKIISKFELQGTELDVQKFISEVKEICQNGLN